MDARVEWPKTANGKLRKDDVREIGASKSPLHPLIQFATPLVTSKFAGLGTRRSREE